MKDIYNKALQFYLKKLESLDRRYPGPSQRMVLKIIAEDGYSSVPLIAKRIDDRISHKNIRKVLVERLLRKKFVKKKEEGVEKSNNYHEDFYELTTLGVHCVLRFGIVEDLAGFVTHYQQNIILYLFLYPYFTKNTIMNVTPSLSKELLSGYFPSICEATEDISAALAKDKEWTIIDRIPLLRKNIINERVFTYLLRLMMLLDQRTVELLAKDDLFFRRITSMKKRFLDPRYEQMLKLRNPS